MATGDFRWNEWNLEHATKHGCSVTEIESVLRNMGHGFPRKVDDKKRLVIGRGQGGRVVRVIYVLDPDRTAYVIHAMPVTTRRRRGR
jgi:uncharacterized DUF497 family protein